VDASEQLLNPEQIKKGWKVEPYGHDVLLLFKGKEINRFIGGRAPGADAIKTMSRDYIQTWVSQYRQNYEALITKMRVFAAKIESGTVFDSGTAIAAAKLVKRDDAVNFVKESEKSLRKLWDAAIWKISDLEKNRP